MLRATDRGRQRDERPSERYESTSPLVTDVEMVDLTETADAPAPPDSRQEARSSQAGLGAELLGLDDDEGARTDKEEGEQAEARTQVLMLIGLRS